jgi:uncharacterized protein involved in outer membrane biogenesis
MNKFKFLALGVTLAVLLVLAYAGPGRIDQARLRAWVAPELERALRQGVAVDGAIDFALLPRPMVKVRQVKVARDGKLIADMPEIEANLKLWPLLMGKLEPDSLVLSRPDIHLEALPAPPSRTSAIPAPGPAPDTAAVDATPPSNDVSSKSGLGVPRAIGRVVIEKGSLTLPEIGGQQLHLAPVDLQIVTADDAVSISGRVMAGQTGIHIEGDAHWLGGVLQATALTLRVDGGAVLHWTGQGDPLSGDHPLTGKLSARLDDPATLLGDMAAVPVGLAGDVTIKPGQVEANNLLLSIGDAELRGDGRLDTGDMPRATLTLHAATLDLQKGAPPSKPASPAAAPRVPPPPALATPAKAPAAPSAAKQSFPLLGRTSVELSLSADQILWRGQVLQDARLGLTAANGEITLNQAVVTLPGNSQVSLVGNVVSSDVGEASFDGAFEAKSDDFRALLRWANLDPLRVPEDRLRSVRLAGHVKGDLTQITLEGVRIKADSSQIDLSAVVRPGPRLSFGVTFALDQLNADAYWPANPPAASGSAAAAGPVPGDLPPPEPGKSQDFGIDAEIHGKVGRLAWHGQTAQDLALDIALSPEGAVMRSVTVADLAGAQASFSGTLSRAADGLRLDHGKAMVHSRDIARTARMLGAELPFDGQVDISADINGPLASPSLVLTAPMLNAGKTWFDHVSLDLSLPPGKLAFDHVTAGLYGGQLTGQASLARDGGASSLHLALAGGQMKKALIEAADMGLADGELSGEATLTSAGKSDAELKANLAGTMSVAVKNGEIKGFDLKAANDRLNGKDGIGGLLALLSAGLTGGETHFSALTASAKADHGVIVSNDIALIAEGGDAKGAATVSLPADTIDSHIDFRFANAHDAPPLSMRLQGSLKSPHRYLDVKPLQQWLADHGIKTGKPKDVLKGLLQGLVK